MRHLGDELSALIDGRLDRAGADAARRHIAACPGCSAELDAVRAARRLVRELPAVFPPAGFLEAVTASGAAVLDSRRSSHPSDGSRAAAVLAPAVLAVAALAAIALGGDPGGDTAQPALVEAVSRHAATVRQLAAEGVSTADGGSEPMAPPAPVTPTTAEPVTEPAGAWMAPQQLAGGYRLVGAFRQPEGLQLTYESGRYGLSVFQQRGHLDPAMLPAGAVPVAVGGRSAWRWEGDPARGRLVVTQIEGLVVTVVGDEPGEAVIEAVRSLPAPGAPGVAERLLRGTAELVEALSPAG